MKVASLATLLCAAVCVAAQGQVINIEQPGNNGTPTNRAPATTGRQQTGRQGTAKGVVFKSPGGKFSAAGITDGRNVMFAMWSPGSQITGYLGLGVGTSMTGADITVGWFNNGKPVVSSRSGTGHVAPTVTSPQTVQLLNNPPAALVALHPATLSVANQSVIYFQRTLAASGTGKAITATGANSMIFACSTTKVNAGAIVQHGATSGTDYGKFQLALDGGATGGNNGNARNGNRNGATPTGDATQPVDGNTAGAVTAATPATAGASPKSVISVLSALFAVIIALVSL